MKPMLPSLTFDPPTRPGWLYEVKYDGFRALLEWKNDHLQLISRNGKSLLPQFPEIQEFLERNTELFLPFLPLQLDGELVVLENRFKANFSAIQGRGRLKSEKKIQEQATITPCHLLVFDILKIQGRDLLSVPYIKRKEELSKLFNAVHFNRNPDTSNLQLLQCIEPYSDFQEIWRNVVLYDGEGIIAKQKTSLWKEGKRSGDWLKYKNWKYVSCFITEMDKTNHYFGVGVFKEKDVYRLGKILFGLKPEEKQILSQTLKHNKQDEDAQFIYVEPAICLEVKYLEVFENELREPYFDRFRFDLSVEDCSFDQFMLQQKNLPTDLEITHPDKALWTEMDIKKSSYIHYLREISPYTLPFLTNRALTVIRYPHGIHGEAFYQKNCPDYAPDFVQTYSEKGIDFILCNNVETLIWLGNQLAIEFHIPFQTIRYSGPEEIIFDLDPPSKDDFPLAIKGVSIIKEVLDELNLTSFVKTSGNKGLQVYIPLPENTYTYEETRLFTSFIADYLVSRDPNSFTIERMKKNRGGRLYVDYVQHAEGKTIIAPYSLRGNEWAGVATPLFWEEVNEKLSLESFCFQNTLKRLQTVGDPFREYFHSKQHQAFTPVLDFLRASAEKKNKKG